MSWRGNIHPLQNYIQDKYSGKKYVFQVHIIDIKLECGLKSKVYTANKKNNRVE